MGTAEVRELFTRMGRARTLGLAAEMSFWLFLALIPLAVVGGLAAAKLAVSDANIAASVLSTTPSVAREMLQQQVARVAEWHGGTVAPAAIAVFLWLASSGIHAVFDAMEAETGCSRPWWRKRLVAIGACIMLSVGVVLVTILGTGLGWLWRLAGEAVPEAARVAESTVIGRALRLFLGAVVAFGLTTGLFVLGVPKDARCNMPVVPGAALAVVLDAVLGLGYAFYVSKAGTGGAYQAGLAAIGVTMTALYLSSTAILVGLELNVVLGSHRHPAPAPGAR